MMKACLNCKELAVDPDQPPHYDILNAEFDVDVSDLRDFGPYCAECFDTTETGKIIAENNQPKEL